MRVLKNCAVLVGLLCSVSVAGYASDDLGQALRAELQGKVLMLRGFPIDHKLSFDSNFQSTGQIHTGSWTLAEMQVDKVQLKDDEIEISGKRVGFAFDEKSHALVKTRLRQQIKIQSKGPFVSSSGELIKNLRDRVFVMDFQELSVLAPPSWKAYLNGDVKKVTKDNKTFFKLKEFDSPIGKEGTDSELEGLGKLHDGELLYRVKKNVVEPPKPILTPDPKYTEFARSAQFQGMTVLSVVILSTGATGDISVVRPLGLGLDDEAVAVVQNWKFQPATKDGKPVACLVNVEVNFNLY